ncbi:MAG TPA: PEGA domain-containing protein [Thermoanaerobaculia bacterium]|nr:PEGA domain-containing protein [Thermoanaerobaculia bacterium]
MNLRQSIEKLRAAGPLPLLLLALLLATRGDLLAQEDRSPANESFDSGGAESRIDPSPPPEAPSAPPPDSSSGTPPDSSSDSGRRHAVPVDTPVEPQRQPPSHGRHAVPKPPVEPPPSGDGGDVDTVPDALPVASDLGLSRDLPRVEHSSYPVRRRSGSRRLGGQGMVGRLDLDVSPGRTQVYLDGQYLGIVDRYDGWPSYLWLEKGTYDLVFYLDGYKTLVRRVTIYPGAVLGLEDRLEPGPSVRPEDLD